MSNLSKFSRVAILFISLMFLYFFFVYFTPFIAKSYFPNWQRYIEGAQEHNIETGALFYTDVPVTADAFYNFQVILRDER